MFHYNDLYHICNKYNFFTGGTNKQYNQLFEYNDTTPHLHDIALIIYICSYNYTLEEIENILKKEYNTLYGNTTL